VIIGIAPVVKAVVVESATILQSINVVIKVRVIGVLKMKMLNAAMVPLKAKARVVTPLIVKTAPIEKRRRAGGALSAAAIHASCAVRERKLVTI